MEDEPENQYGERFAPVLTPRDIKRESLCEAHLPIYGVPCGIGRDGLTGIRIPVSVTRLACTGSNILTSWPTVCSVLQSPAVNSIRPQGRYTSAGSLPMARLLVAFPQTRGFEWSHEAATHPLHNHSVCRGRGTYHPICERDTHPSKQSVFRRGGVHIPM